MTLGDQWAYKPDDHIKSLEQCVQTLVRCAGGDGNLLLNVGPMPTGCHRAAPGPAAPRDRLVAEAERRERSTAPAADRFKPTKSYATTRKGTLRLRPRARLGRRDREPARRSMPGSSSARVLGGGSRDRRAPAPRGSTLNMPAADRQPIDTDHPSRSRPPRRALPPALP